MSWCIDCGVKWAQGPDRRCRGCHRSTEAGRQERLDMARAIQAFDERLARDEANVTPVLRTVVVEGQEYDVVFDGAVRDVEIPA